MRPEYVLSVSVVGFIVLFVFITAGATYYTSTSGDYVKNDTQSEDKITVLNEAFRSALGPKWPIVILVFIIFVAISLYFLYLSFSNNAISINMSPAGEKRFNTIFFYFTLIFGIFMVLLVVKQYLNYRRTNSVSSNYIPSQDQNKKDTQILIIIGLLLFVIGGGGYAWWYIFRKPDNRLSA
jgi:flagellar basal body-associated protein FliL